MKICQCPGAEALPNIPNLTCGENFGQIARIAFQRIYKTGNTKNAFTAEADIKELASWQKLKTEDGSKVVLTPIVEAPTQDGGDAITFGGGNETFGGMERIIGSQPTTFSFSLRDYPQSIIAALKKLQCEKNLGVYLFNESGQIEAEGNNLVPTTYEPIPIFNLFVGDKIHGGFDTPDSNMLKFSLPANYSDDLVIITPNFDPLTDLDMNAE